MSLLKSCFGAFSNFSTVYLQVTESIKHDKLSEPVSIFHKISLPYFRLMVKLTAVPIFSSLPFEYEKWFPNGAHIKSVWRHSCGKLKQFLITILGKPVTFYAICNPWNIVFHMFEPSFGLYVVCHLYPMDILHTICNLWRSCFSVCLNQLSDCKS